ncbi:MAG: hypothetical protein OWT28_06105 [Firmicutes bacterium]|nr:hypothetical protein [Bacillota bacterium]
MANFKRLRFVPMIIRAYYNAQEQLAAQHAGSTSNVIKTRLATAKTSSSAAVKTNRVARLDKRKKSPATLPPSVVSNQDLSQLLRELRATNRQLKGLQTLKSDLKEMEGTLREMNKKIALEPPVQATRAAAPSTIPAARYPFR